jgi:hypothetical protein
MSEEAQGEFQPENNTNWRDSLPEQLRDAPFIGKAESIDDAIGKLAHAAKLVGTSVRIPGEDASEEDRNAFYDKLKDIPGVARLPLPDDVDGLNDLLSKLGRPEEPSKYDAPEIENFEWDDNMLRDLRTYAHEAGMTHTQFKVLAAKIAEQEINADKSTSAERQAEREKLKTDWGDAVEGRENLIRGWLEQSGAPKSMVDLLDNHSLPADTVKWLYDTASQFEDTTNPISKDRSESSPTTVTPEQARARIQEILANPAYFNATDPRHKDIVNDMLKYQRLANPNQAA